MTTRNCMMWNTWYRQFALCNITLCKIFSFVNWFMFTPCKQSILKTSNRNPSLNRLGKILIRKPPQFSWISDGESYTIAFDDEWFQFWHFKPTYKPIFKRISGQNYWSVLIELWYFQVVIILQRENLLIFYEKKDEIISNRYKCINCRIN